MPKKLKTTRARWVLAWECPHCKITAVRENNEISQPHFCAGREYKVLPPLMKLAKLKEEKE